MKDFRQYSNHAYRNLIFVAMFALPLVALNACKQRSEVDGSGVKHIPEEEEEREWVEGFVTKKFADSIECSLLENFIPEDKIPDKETCDVKLWFPRMNQDFHTPNKFRMTVDGKSVIPSWGWYYTGVGEYNGYPTFELKRFESPGPNRGKMYYDKVNNELSFYGPETRSEIYRFHLKEQ